MKIPSLKYILLLLFVVNGILATAQNGAYEVRVTQYNTPSYSDKYLLDIEVKAVNASSNFFIADANFVLTFDENVIANPVIQEELYLSGGLSGSGYTVLFEPHTLTGSVDSFLTYNLVMVGGTGYPINELEWVPVGRVAFDIVDPNASPQLIWKTSSDFPPTVVLEKVDNDLHPMGAANNTYNNQEEFLLGAIDDYNVEVYAGIPNTFYPLDNDLGPIDPSTATVITAPQNGTAFFDSGAMVYTSDPSYIGEDTISYSVCELGLPSNCDTANVTVNVMELSCDTNTDCVWPGDGDNSTIVDHFDLLNLGIAYGTAGPQRPNASLDWEAQAALDWQEATPLSMVNYKHIDTDGNGIIEDADTTAISLNWGSSYNPVNLMSKSGAPFFIDTTIVNPDTTIFLPLILGDLGIPVEDAYGLAFSIQYDEGMVNPASALLILNDSWLGNTTDLLMMQRNFEMEGRLDVGITRTDGIPASGAGEIGVLQLTIKDDVLLDLYKEVHLNLSIENARLQKNTEEEIAIDTQSSTVTITDEVLGLQILENLGLSVYPNPVLDQLQVQVRESLDLLQISNVLGQVIHVEKDLNTKTIDSSNWPTGIYTLTAQKGKASYTMKLVKK